MPHTHTPTLNNTENKTDIEMNMFASKCAIDTTPLQLHLMDILPNLFQNRTIKVEPFVCCVNMRVWAENICMAFRLIERSITEPVLFCNLETLYFFWPFVIFLI